ncbi:MAG: hypothetical protein M3O36_04775 [Myxococcota bacterium]|nr:hypothetical protein [Myxococcota bacterium]
MIESVRASLALATRDQAALQQQLALSRTREASSDTHLPTAEQIIKGALDIEARLRSDPVAARRALGAVLLDGRITMEPQPDGSYRAGPSSRPFGSRVRESLGAGGPPWLRVMEPTDRFPT